MRDAVALAGTATCFFVACGASPASRSDERADTASTHVHHFNEPAKYAERWNDPQRDAWQKPEEITRALGLSAGEAVADLGAGTGYLIPFLREAVGEGGKVIAIDIEKAMVDYLRDAASKKGWTNVTVRQSKVDDPSLDKGEVHAVVILNTWHHIANRIAFAKGLRAAIKPGGYIVIVDFLKEETEGFGPPAPMRLAEHTVVDELRGAGFEAQIVEETLPRHYILRGRRSSVDE